MRKVFILALALAALACLGVYMAAESAETFGWTGLKTHLLVFGTGAFVIVYVIGGAISHVLGTPWESSKRK